MRLIQETQKDPFGGIGKPESCAAAGQSVSTMSIGLYIELVRTKYASLRADIITDDKTTLHDSRR